MAAPYARPPPGRQAILRAPGPGTGVMIIGHWPDAVIDHSPDSLDIRIPLPRRQSQRPQPQPASRQVRPLVTLGR